MAYIDASTRQDDFGQAIDATPYDVSITLEILRTEL